MNTQKIALVTGASRGIGAAIAKKLAQDGYFVWIHYRSGKEAAEMVLNQIQSCNGRGQIISFDVSKSEEVDQAFSTILKTSQRLDALICNAGMTKDGLLARLSDEDLEHTLSVDLKGAIYCCRAATRPMMKQKSGSIVLISSVTASSGSPGQTAYTAAKAGLYGFAKSAAKELASRSIRVNVVSPGFIETDMTSYLTEAQKTAYTAQIPMNRMGKPEDISGPVSFLVSDLSQYITGQILGVNGGMYC